MSSGDSVVLEERGAAYDIPGQRGFGMTSWQGNSAWKQSVIDNLEIRTLFRGEPDRRAHPSVAIYHPGGVVCPRSQIPYGPYPPITLLSGDTGPLCRFDQYLARKPRCIICPLDRTERVVKTVSSRRIGRRDQNQAEVGGSRRCEGQLSSRQRVIWI
jgi:hypothetical protein